MKVKQLMKTSIEITVNAPPHVQRITLIILSLTGTRHLSFITDPNDPRMVSTSKKKKSKQSYSKRSSCGALLQQKRIWCSD
mmetsp:Transcript_32633/g.75121  ORF Transcript_32633/g.75121 Transcript_32633/m.75121 type:complete len:81 (+) Transcript_32633:1459-1701(+)